MCPGLKRSETAAVPSAMKVLIASASKSGSVIGNTEFIGERLDERGARRRWPRPSDGDCFGQAA